MEPRVFFEEVRGAYAEASRRVPASRLDLKIAGHPVTIQFAEPSLARRLTPALEHHRQKTPNAEPDLRIMVWDTTASGTPPPPPPWGPYDYREKGRIRGFNEDGIHTAYRVGENVLCMFDEQTGDALFWTPDAASLPEYQTGSPFLTILQWWAECRGLTLIHAGAVGKDGRGVLLAGPGGSGKSTTSLACAETDGFEYLSDDYCLLDGRTGRALSLYSTGKLDAHSLTLLPRYADLVGGPSQRKDGKAVVYFARHLSDRLTDELAVRAILLPSTTGGATSTVEPASPAQALQALAPSTIFQLTGAGRRSFSTMAALVRRVPSFRLGLSRDMQDVPAIIGDLIAQLEAEGDN